MHVKRHLEFAGLRDVLAECFSRISDEGDPDGTEKQDCEVNAGKRLIAGVRKTHPKLPLLIIGDSLYSKQPFIEDLKAGRNALRSCRQGGGPQGPYLRYLGISPPENPHLHAVFVNAESRAPLFVYSLYTQRGRYALKYTLAAPSPLLSVRREA